jgi:hypothetical protein
VNVLDGTITSDKIANGAVTAEKVSLNNSLFPTVDDSFDLGSTQLRFNTIYTHFITTGDLNLRSEQGDWSVIEQEDYIKLRNNKTGKNFKIVMEAID